MPFFGFGKSAIEKRLIETYAEVLQARFGAAAKKVAREWVEMARQQAEAAGTLHIQHDYDAYMRLVQCAPEAQERLAAKRRDGVSEQDLRRWWGMHELERRMVQIDDENARMAFFLAKRQVTGLSAEEAASATRKAFPMYGNPLDTGHTDGVDRPLPDELKDRVNRWLRKLFATKSGYERRSLEEGFSSLNALIRSEIRNGHV